MSDTVRECVLVHVNAAADNVGGRSCVATTWYHATMKHIVALVVLGAVGVGAYALYSARTQTPHAGFEDIDPPSQTVTMAGTYTCLPHRDASPLQAGECAFGLVTRDGVHYAVNFGASADAMQQFQQKLAVTASGFLVGSENLGSEWGAYDMQGLFTITTVLSTTTPDMPSEKLDIGAVCAGALTYMTFPDGEAADAFIAACVAGEHPEVIERYREEAGLGAASL